MGVDPEPVYALIREVPKGEVASYGMIASLVPGAGPRQVARAMRSAPDDLPWFRIVTASGAIADHDSASRQRELLRKEGVTFRRNGCVDWKKHLWRGPSQEWLARSGMDPHDAMQIISGWSHR